IRDLHVTGVQTCALPIYPAEPPDPVREGRVPDSQNPAGVRISAGTDKVGEYRNVVHSAFGEVIDVKSHGREGCVAGLAAKSADPAADLCLVPAVVHVPLGTDRRISEILATRVGAVRNLIRK